MSLEMAVPTDESTKRHPIQKMTLNSDKIRGLEDFAVDEEVEVRLKLRVLKPMGHQAWDKEDLKKPLEGEYEILSGKAVSVQSKIDKAETIDELDKAVEGDD
jgi:hypothetical protein